MEMVPNPVTPPLKPLSDMFSECLNEHTKLLLCKSSDRIRIRYRLCVAFNTAEVWMHADMRLWLNTCVDVSCLAHKKNNNMPITAFYPTRSASLW